MLTYSNDFPQSFVPAFKMLPNYKVLFIPAECHGASEWSLYTWLQQMHSSNLLTTQANWFSIMMVRRSGFSELDVFSDCSVCGPYIYHRE